MDVSKSIESCASGDVMEDEETLEDCMTMLDLAMEKLDRAAQGLCSSGLGLSEMDDFTSLEIPPEHQNQVAPVICCDSFLESQTCDGSKDNKLFFDLLSVGDESVLNFITLPNGFYA